MEKAIEIKRRAQRCIQNGDLDGALSEYEKLVGFEDSDPYNFVLLADLLYKKGEHADAAERYLSAVASYEKASLYKNAIAVCKKMTRLSLTPAKVLKALANLHALDGLSSEAALYYVQYAEHMVRTSAPAEAADALRKAFDVSQDNVRVLEQLAEAWLLAGDQHQAAQAMVEAAQHYQQRGEAKHAARCRKRATSLDASVSFPAGDGVDAADAAAAGDVEFGTIERLDPQGTSGPSPDFAIEPTARAGADSPAADAMAAGGVEGFDSGRHDFGPVGGDRADVPAGEAGASPDDFAVSEAEITAYGEVETPVAGGRNGEDPHEGAAVPVMDAADDGTPGGEPVYDLSGDEPATAGNGPGAGAGSSPATAPGLTFGAPVAHGHSEGPQSPASHGTNHAAPSEATSHEIGLQQVEVLLTQAQEQFRSGDREQASNTLARAAQAYEVLGRFDSAATIYRSLGRSASVPLSVLELWLINCERRGDTKEAATVACEMGDRALGTGNETEAKRWFERAVAFDAQNELARRRLQRLASGGGRSAGPVAVATAPADAPPMEAGRVEVAVGRGEAVTFDLSGLLAEFQRGVEAQLAGDAQSHYDLGMAYREMGLLEQAVDSFRVAVGEPALAPRALEMIGRCHIDQSRWAEAVGEFRRALQFPAGKGGDAELRFHYAHALVELGEPEAALGEYEKVAAQMPGYEDVHDRIAALRRVLGRA